MMIAKIFLNVIYNIHAFSGNTNVPLTTIIKKLIKLILIIYYHHGLCVKIYLYVDKNH